MYNRGGHLQLGAPLRERRTPGSAGRCAWRSPAPERRHVPRNTHGGTEAVVGAHAVRRVGAHHCRRVHRQHIERPQHRGLGHSRQRAQTARVAKRVAFRIATGGPHRQSAGMARNARRGWTAPACQPYSAEEETAFREAAELPGADDPATSLWIAAASCGAGMRGPEISAAETGDLTEIEEDRLLVRVRGRDSRIVPIRACWTDTARQAVRLARSGPTRAPGSSSRKTETRQPEPPTASTSETPPCP